MDLDLLFLGTSASVPTARRAPAATLIRRGGERILLDCAEGTQRQLLRSPAGLADLDLILLTHHHADHVLGLPGMLKTFALRGREHPLPVAGPAGLRGLIKDFGRVIGRLTFELELIELDAGASLPGDGYRIEAFATQHRGLSIGFALCEEHRPGRFDVEAARALGVPEGPLFGMLQHGQAVDLPSGERLEPERVVGPARPGRRIVFSGDTRPCPGTLEASAAADLLVHEATFLEDEAERARQTGHSTAAEAAALARDAQVRLLALTHLSTRHTAHEVRDEAREVFPNTVVPRDFDVIELPFTERGEPRLVRGDEAAPPPAPDPA